MNPLTPFIFLLIVITATACVAAYLCHVRMKLALETARLYRELHALTAADLDALSNLHREYCRATMGTERYDALIKQAQSEVQRRGRT